jgi:CheY-like chemotaxis protein/anti-sigma regulatory factor (Ser/Thr protein kinase)
MEKVLVVDDSAEDRETAADCLRDHGMVPLFAANGREALDVIASQPPDAVLTDLHMPEMSGLELVERMRRKYPRMPVVLMTSQGSEESAMCALKAGALSYVPKNELRNNLCDAMAIVVSAVEVKRHREKTRAMLEHSESRYVVGCDLHAAAALVSHLEGNLDRLHFCDDTVLFQMGTALGEALGNAVDHGCLELDSEVREEATAEYAKLRQERAAQHPYCDRKVRVTERITSDQATYVITDEGSGFDVSSVPDPRHAENLLRASGRGLMLIRTFMDEVTFNERGNEITLRKKRAVA